MAHPSDALALAEQLFRAGRTREAEQALSADSARPESAARLREYLIAEGRQDEAIALVRQHDGAVNRAVEAFFDGRFDQALAHCESALAKAPDDGPARLHRARCLHNLGQRTTALDAFQALVNNHPGMAEAWYACGHALRANGREEAACEAYRKALNLSPGLRAARLNLGMTCLNLDRADQARACFEFLLDRWPDDVDALIHLGLALHLDGQSRPAIRRLKRGLILAPDHPAAHRFLAAIYNQSGDAEAARHHLERALGVQPDDPDLWAELADIHELSSRLDAAREALERGLRLAADHPQLNLMAARLARREGELDRAHGRLQAIPSQNLPPRLALQHAQELAIVLDRLDQAEAAYAQMIRANELAGHDGRLKSVDRGAFRRELDAIADWLPRAAPWASTTGDRGGDLVFLVGFTRSGTTLLDTFFKPHPDVHTVEEKPTIERVIQDIEGAGGRYPAALDALSEADREALRQRYRGYLKPFLPADRAARVIDRMPLRLIHAGFVQRLFPEARLLLAVRHPCDVVLSNFMQIFEPGDALVHCNTLASTVDLYDRVMQLWWQIEPPLGDRLIRVGYETLVHDPAAELEVLCGSLGIDFEPAMLEQRRERAATERVRTASYQQVNETLYTRAAGRWKRYRRQMEPFFDVLEPHARRLGYPPLSTPTA
jgi:tetratricopeptide (TPR) repeat protein